MALISTPLIRPAIPKDIPVLRSIYYQTRVKEFPWCRNSILSLSDFDAETEGELILVAEVDHRPAGYLSMWIETGFIHHLFIAKSFRNHGIGSMLLVEAAKHSPQVLSLKCMSENTDALSFYHKEGFVSTGEGVCAEGPWTLLELRDSCHTNSGES